MKLLHPTQKALLELLKSNIDDPLTIRELQERLNISSPSVVYHHIRQLEKRRYLKRNPHNPKDYQILSEPEKPIVYLNLYGMAQCGPDGTLLSGNPDERVPIASQLIRFPAEDAFLVKARGDSMQPKIDEGDLVIACKSNTAVTGNTIVCVYDGKVLIKKFHSDGRQFILQSENESKYLPILTRDRKVKIEGIVKGVIKYN